MGFVGRSIRNNILFGLILVTPVGVTALVVGWLFRIMTNGIVSLVPISL